jgi:peptidoglycan-N-acetylglucosamine deacetylase
VDLGLAPGTLGPLARFKAVLELLDYMHAKGGVWFARLDQVCDHVQRLVAEGRWRPRYETFPLYQSPLPEFSKDRRGHRQP